MAQTSLDEALSDYSANVKIEGIARDVWDRIERIATQMQLPKKAIVKLALEEFAERHAPEATRLKS